MLSVFDIFKVGIGPSSSHTVGPMRAARRFAKSLEAQHLLAQVARVRVELFGSLGATGRGHATDQGVILGLLGEEPHAVDPEAARAATDGVRSSGLLNLLGAVAIDFDASNDILFLGNLTMVEHPNALRFKAFDDDGNLIAETRYFSVGGGFVVEEGESQVSQQEVTAAVPYAFSSGRELLDTALANQLSIPQLVLANELTWRSEEEVRAKLLHIWEVMRSCVRRGLGIEGDVGTQLPGSLRLRRRAVELHRKLLSNARGADPLSSLDWVNAFAIAVNEENAAGGRVVTAPTNGAAGIIPAVLHYYYQFLPGANEQGIVDFLLTAGAIGMLYKTNASISGAEVGCQGEVGVACSMAAGALTAVQGGSIMQVENAAEIGMEHNLGLTCDPVGGLVQVPCVERNAMGAVKAINAARMALNGDGGHYVSLDAVIRTMKRTGEDMKTIYKETSLGGLAVSVIEC